MEEKTYFEFLQYSIGAREILPESAKAIDWRVIMKWAENQAIVGVIFEGLQKADKKVNIPFNVLMEWIAISEQIAGQNRILNKKCAKVLGELRRDGYECCIIKGQGNALMYPNPYSRTSGDIDVIIRNANRKSLMQYARDKKETAECHYQHAEYNEDGIGVELHFIPCYMNNPMYHQKLQKWFNSQADKDNIWNNDVELPDGAGSIAIPSVEYNLIHQLAHMMHHFFDEGIGLRQFVDYYFVLHARNEESGNLGIRNSGSGDLGMTLRFLGLRKFAGAVMYVMKEVFALDEKYMIAPVDERRGKTLMEEILKGGNFGHHSGLAQNNAAKKYFQKTWRNMQLVKEYPSEALCEPVFRTWHFFWRMAH